MAIVDKEFGEIKIRKNKLARSVKLSVGVDGSLRASIPYYSPEFAVRRLVNGNRDEIRKMLATHNAKNSYQDGDLIGKTHTLFLRKFSGEEIKISNEGNQILVQIPQELAFENPLVQSEIRKTVSKILRKQAKAYLPRRIDFLAEKYGFSFEKLRFSHTGTRWGSCSSSGTISLNIALMNLPHHLIDYVIIHELCHTRQMNHSSKFWQEVEKYCPDYKKYVQEIKQFSPSI
ncbi:MAG: M48 family metallopeptidase [Candidatus Nanogingivalaceae bacterium]|jgi:putative zinc protease|nr:M48 family metallopeptidase [Candidatus Nanogingivalaceae bacterium]